jgi:hypothetical protein
MPWLVFADDRELAMGIEAEQEHAGTIRWLVDRVLLTGGWEGPGYDVDRLVQEMATRIAQDHLKEVPDYYSRLKQMETLK